MIRYCPIRKDWTVQIRLSFSSYFLETVKLSDIFAIFCNSHGKAVDMNTQPSPQWEVTATLVLYKRTATTPTAEKA